MEKVGERMPALFFPRGKINVLQERRIGDNKMPQELSDRDALQIIHDILYRVDGEGMPQYDPDKEWPVDFIEQIAHMVAKRIPRPGDPAPEPAPRKEGDPFLSPEEYAASEGDRCPNCGKNSVESSEHMQSDNGGGGSQQCFCNECGAQWTDCLTLVGYDSLEQEPE